MITPRVPREGGSPDAGRHPSDPGNIIDFTNPNQNQYIRDRSNNSGNTQISGTLLNGTYVPPSNVITSDSQMHQNSDGGSPGGWGWELVPMYDEELGY